MRREVSSARKDARYFTATASKTKSVNLPTKVYRGGFRF